MRQAQRFARFAGEAAADDQRNTAAGAYFVDQHIGFQRKAGKQLAGFVVTHFAFIGVDVDHVAHIQLAYVHFDWQRTRIFHRVEEDWRDFAAQHQTAAFFVRDVRDIVAHEPEYGVGR